MLLNGLFFFNVLYTYLDPLESSSIICFAPLSWVIHFPAPTLPTLLQPWSFFIPEWTPPTFQKAEIYFKVWRSVSVIRKWQLCIRTPLQEGCLWSVDSLLLHGWEAQVQLECKKAWIGLQQWRCSVRRSDVKPQSEGTRQPLISEFFVPASHTPNWRFSGSSQFFHLYI